MEYPLLPLTKLLYYHTTKTISYIIFEYSVQDVKCNEYIKVGIIGLILYGSSPTEQKLSKNQ